MRNASFVFLAMVSLCAGPRAPAETARDPGVRGGKKGAGKLLSGFNLREQLLLRAGRRVFEEDHDVKDGLGPGYNGTSCVSCHAQPDTGGTSPLVNPQIAAATAGGARNRVPSFLSIAGPVRVVRFRFRMKADGTLSDQRDGGVHQLFSIAGRSDAPGCDLAQADFERALALGNVSFRIPTPVFGMGLVEAVSDATILASFAASKAERDALGIQGHPNRSGNDGTITRFGWKAQNKSAEIFAGEAYNVEVGVTNELFPQEKITRASCSFNATPEDHVTLQALLTERSLSDVQKFSVWMRSLAPPDVGPITDSVLRGFAAFKTVGCTGCHTPALAIGPASSPQVQRQKEARLFSDLMLHRMGPGLADDIVQGDAGPDEFRTAPLWGLGQRLFFLHDGRTRDLREAVEAHESEADQRFPASEANASVRRFRALDEGAKQDLLNFLRAL